MIIIDGYINGWDSISEEHAKKVIGLHPYNFFDKFNRPQWKWPDYPDGEPIFSPQPYTPEQLETLRKNHCREEIRKYYSSADEAKILRENITAIAEGRKPTPEFTEYNKTVKAIIDKSKTMDFSKE